MRPTSLSSRYLIHDPRWEDAALINEESVSAALQKVAEILEQDFSSQSCSIALSNDAEVHELNKAFRHKDEPTDVLSFPSDEADYLGDIILAYETVEKDAAEGGILFTNHALHLIVHGFLHLLGYDHENEKDALQMEGLEIRILQALNIANPYEEK